MCMHAALLMLVHCCSSLLDHVDWSSVLSTHAGRSMNVPDMAKVLNHLRRDPVVKVTAVVIAERAWHISLSLQSVTN